MATARLTERRVKALRSRKTVQDIRDTSLKGFGIRIYPTGRKRYFIHTQYEGQRLWKIVGDAGDTALNEARERARLVLAAVRNGNPALPAETVFETVAEEVFHRYGRNWKPGTPSVNRGYYRNQILPWFRGWQIADITPADVQEWFSSLHTTPVAADRSAPVLSVIMTCAETYGYRPDGSNPCKGIKRYRRRGRERFLSEQEVRRLGAVLEQHEEIFPMHVAIIRLLLLTGCRKQEIVTLQWREYRGRHLHLTDTKTGPRMVWLSSPARRILEEMPRCKIGFAVKSAGFGTQNRSMDFPVTRHRKFHLHNCHRPLLAAHSFGCRSAGCPASRSSSLLCLACAGARRGLADDREAAGAHAGSDDSPLRPPRPRHRQGLRRPHRRQYRRRSCDSGIIGGLPR